MKRLAVIAVSIGLVMSVASKAMCGPILTLQRCIDDAVQHSPGLSAYRHLVAAAKEDITKKQGATLPYLSGRLQGYEVNGFPVTPYTALHLQTPEIGVAGNERPTRNPNAHWAPVGIEQIGVDYPLYKEGSALGLNNPPSVASARAVLTQRELLSLIKAQKLILDVSTAFLNAASYRDQLALEEHLVALHEKQLKIVRAQVALGLTLPLEIQVVQAQLDAARRAQESAQQIVRSYSMLLSALTGHGSDYSFELDHTKPPLPPLQSLPEFLKQVMPVHPALRVQQAKVEVARQQLRVDQADLLPTANLNTSFAGGQDLDYFNGNTGHRRPTEFLSYITIDIPLWDFGQRRAATRESEDKVLYEKDSTDQLDLEIRSAITSAYGRIDEYAKNVAIAQSAYTKDQQNLALARAQRREGLIDELALTVAEVADRSAAVSLENETNLERLEYADLQNLAGGTWQWVK